MQFISTSLEGLFIIAPKEFSDDRGYFFESFRMDRFKEATGLDITFVQDNESMSQKGVLRGLHFQNPPYAQGKLIKVVRGSVLDVAVDIRKDSPTYGQHVAETLSAENKKMLWIPPGFAHGFLTLEDDTVFQYKCTNYYNKESEGAIRWDDPDLNIAWNVQDPIVSEKDKVAGGFASFESKF